MIYNPLDNFYKSKIGAFCENESITFRVKGNFNSLSIYYFKDGDKEKTEIPMNKENGVFSLTISLNRGLYFYCFKIDEFNFIGKSKNLHGKIVKNPNYYQLSVYDADYDVPSTIKGGLIYQIFPDRFCRFNNKPIISKDKLFHKDLSDNPVYLPNEQGEILNNDFFGGDLLGIVSKLEYLKDLGVNAIYLNPIFKAYSNHRYDTADYFNIDETLGSNADFKFLLSECHKRGIKVILDGVFNHTGDDSIYFNKYGNYDSVGAYQSENSPYYNWFDFISYPKKYNSWWGIKTLPTTNKNSGFVDFIAGENGVVSHYTKLGVDGWRLDVVDELPKEFVQKIRKAVKSINKDAIIIGEVWEDATNKFAYDTRREYFLGKELDSVMNYPLKNAIIDYCVSANADSLIELIITQIDHHPKIVLDTLMNILSTHDTYRIISALANIDTSNLDRKEIAKISLTDDEYNKAISKLKIATVLQFTLYGVPSIYYGDEIGMQGFKDPFNRAFFKWNEVDNEVNKWYKNLCNIRKSISAFIDGEVSNLHANKGLITYTRKDDISEVLVIVNADSSSHTVEFDGRLVNLIDGNTYDNLIEINGEFCGIFVNID